MNIVEKQKIFFYNLSGKESCLEIQEGKDFLEANKRVIHFYNFQTHRDILDDLEIQEEELETAKIEKIVMRFSAWRQPSAVVNFF